MQRQILTLAAENAEQVEAEVQAEVRRSHEYHEMYGWPVMTAEQVAQERASTPDLYFAEIFHHVYGWQPCRKFGEVQPDELSEVLRNDYCSPFSKRTIGNAQYNRAMAAVSRAVKRLKQRELVEIIARGPLGPGKTKALKLTDKGRAEHQRMTQTKDVSHVSQDTKRDTCDARVRCPL